MSDDKTGRCENGSKTDSAFSKKPKASRRRPLNRNEMEAAEDLNISTSAKKLKQPVFAAISNVVVCKVCHSEVKFTETNSHLGVPRTPVYYTMVQYITSRSVQKEPCQLFINIMNKFGRYTFSQEVKSNLADFLKVAELKTVNSYDKQWETLLPTNESLINELRTLTAQNESVIDLTDENSFSSKKCDISTESVEEVLKGNNDISMLGNDLKETLNISSIQNLADSLKEYLSSEEDLEDILCDISNHNNNEITDVFSLLSESLNVELICKLGHFILSTNHEELRIIRFYLKYLLIPKLFTDSNKQIVSIFEKFLENFLNVTSEELSRKINDDTSEYPKYILNTLGSLSTFYKQQLLRDLVSNSSELHHYHFPIIDTLLYKDLQIEILQNLMGLLIAASPTFSDDNIFGKTLLNIIKSAGNNVLHFRQQLNTIVGAHQSIWKTKLQKEIKEYLDNNSMLSQSLRY